MPPQFWTTAAVLLLSCLHLINADEIFIDTPTSVNASLGSMVHLRCIARCRMISWKIDGISASKPEVVQRNIRFSSKLLSQNKAQSTLHILASVANNNTVIVCRAVVAPGHVVSAEEAVLRVQGVLGAPSQLQVLATKKSIVLRWSAPFTLNSEPDILNYTLHINNLNSDQVMAVNVTNTNFTFQVVDPNACHIYEFQVSAWSMSGEGYRSEPVEAAFLGVPYSIHYRQLSAVVIFSPSGIPNVQLRVERATAVCKGKQPDYFTVVLQGTYDSRQQVFMQEINSTQQSRITLKLPRTLAPNEIYNALVIPGNAAGNSTYSIGSILISTFDTQAAYVTVMDSGDVCVTCYFAEGTNAQGCMVVLATSMSVTIKSFTAFRNSNSAKLCDKIENGVSTEDRYTCKVYDVEHNAEVGNQPAYTIRRIPVISSHNITYTATTDEDLCTRQKNSTVNRVFIDTPTSVNASLGSMVHLRCIARCRTILWKIDGISASKPEVVQRNIRFSSKSLSQNKVQSTLHILASVANNNTVIVCRAVVAPGTVVSAEEAVLRVQGLGPTATGQAVAANVKGQN